MDTFITVVKGNKEGGTMAGATESQFKSKKVKSKKKRKKNFLNFVAPKL